MDKQRTWRTRARWLVVGGFFIFMGLVVYRSFHISGYQCSVCISFAGQSVCRTVEGATALDARTAAVDNACAFLAAGVTDTIACQRTTPTNVDCRAMN